MTEHHAIEAVRRDLARHEAGYSWGAKYNDIADLLQEYDKLRAELRTAKRTIWLIVSTSGGYTLERHDMENYPGDDVAQMEWTEDPVTRDMTFRAYT